MKRRKLLSLVTAVLIIIIVMTACGAKKAYDKGSTSSLPQAAASDSNMSTGYGEDVVYTAKEETKALEEEAGTSFGSTTSTSTSNSTVQSNEKIIRTFFMDVETQEFDSLISRINSDINRMGGYVESSEISGRSYSYANATRYGQIIARVPSGKVDGFVNSVNENANVISKQESTENVSLQYIETESKIETLRIEQERLYALLEKEDSLDDIIVLEKRLSEIRYELQNHESQIRYYDNKVAYSTVTLSIQEVVKLTPVSEQKETLGTRIKNGLGTTIYNLSEGFKNFLVWFIVNLPYLLIWGVIITIIVIVIRRGVKKYNTKKATSPTPIKVDSIKSEWDSHDDQI